MNQNNPTEDDLDLESQPSSGEEDFAPDSAQEDEQNQTDEGGKPKRDRSAEGRIAELTAKNKELENRLEEQEKQRVPMPPSGNELSTEEAQAKTLLTGKLGVVDRDTLNKEVQALENRMMMQSRHDRLEDVYDGEDGRPKYDRKEVEDFMRNRGDVFDPEIAYRELYRDELLDWEVKKATSGKKTQPYTAGPTTPSKREDGAITAEKIAEMQSKGKEVFIPWYQKNRDKILALQAEGKL